MTCEALGMTDFRTILLWELRHGVRRASTWVYFAICFALTFLPMLVLGGAWDLGAPTGASLVNSPHALSTLFPVVSLMMLSVTAAIAGNALHRDYEAGIEQLLYSTPIQKSEFLAGRFVGAVALNLIILSGSAFGAALAAASPFVKPEKMAPFELSAYVGPYLAFVAPNVVLSAAIFFALMALTRQMMPIYAGGVLLLVGYLIAGLFLQDLDNKTLAALLDPFGLRAQDSVTQYWSIAEKNTLHVPFDGVILANRLIWLSAAFAIFAFAYRRFRFAYDVEDKRSTIAPILGTPAVLSPEVFLSRVQPAELPLVTRRFDWRARLIQFRAVVTRSFWRIVANRYFAVIVGAGLLVLGLTAIQAGRMFGTPTWPVTYHMVDLLFGSFGVVLIIVIVAVYSGELVWADRDVKAHQIVDSTTVPSWVLFLGKLTALCGMIALLMVIMIVAGIVTQTLKGYYRFEIPLYIQSMFGVYFVDMILFAALAMAVHVFVNHKYVGHLLVVLIVSGLGGLPAIGLERGLYQYMYDSGTTYSDMNGWGPFLVPFMWWKAYWLAFCVLLLVVTNLFWIRGEETGPVWRARLARLRFGRPVRMLSAAAGITFAGLGGFLYYNTDHLNIFRTGKENRRLTAEREKRYKRYEKAPQPRVTAVSVRIDLHPRQQDMVVSGHYVLQNTTGVAIDTIHLSLTESMAIRALSFDEGGTRLLADSVRDYHMYRLPRTLQPGDTTVMRFELALETRGIPNNVSNTSIVGNGTFVSSGLMPTIGYNDRGELSDPDARRKEGLRPKERLRPPTDSTTRQNNYINDADWIRFDATVSTDLDQTAIAPGYLQREWVENGRRVFHYTMDAPILNFWAVLSGRYAVKRDQWRDSSPGAAPVEIAVFYHPTHAYNVDRMIAAVKKSLTYYTKQFGPYQHRQVRIIEFPRYATFAQSLPNMIPYSEAIGFIARVEEPDDIDYPYYVTAHEVAHAWWGHQVVGAEAQGVTMLSETLASYSGLMVMEKEFGARNMRRFLAYKLDNYLMGRSTEGRREMPLQLVESQAYIHYHKGALVMYALRDYIGEEAVNRTLRRFLESAKFKGPPYPTSLDLVAAFRNVTPDSLKYVITDLFETITLFELRADSAIVTDAPGQKGKFQVDLWVRATKLRADSLGRETEIAMRDWIDIGVYARAPRGTESQDKNGVPLHLAKQRVDSGAQRFTIVVDQRPHRAGIDPLEKLTDRVPGANTVSVIDRSTPDARLPRRDTAKRDSVPR
jgi:ABC-2 type transport system permease protein